MKKYDLILFVNVHAARNLNLLELAEKELK